MKRLSAEQEETPYKLWEQHSATDKELANWIGNKNNSKDVAIINFQLVGISRVKKEKEK